MAEQGLEIEDLDSKLGSNVGKELGDLSLPVEIFSGSLTKDLPIQAEGVTFSLSGSAGIYGFNSVDDADPLSVIGPPAEVDGLELGPQIVIEPGSAWLKYQAQAGAKAAGGLDKSGFAFSLEAEGGVLVATYRIHEPTEKVGQAARDDLASPRLIFSKRHIRALERGEAVALQARGKLSAGLELKWGDVFASNLNAFGELLGEKEAFAINVDAGVTASFDVSVEDDFLVVFSRPAAGRLRVAVKKTDKKSLKAALTAKIGAEFADPEAAQGVLEDVLDGLLGASLGEVEKLLEKVSFEDLGAAQKAIAERLLDRFDLGEPEDRLAALRDKLIDLRERAREKIEQIATTRVELGFSYEYSRITTESVLIQATLRDGRLDEHHGDLIRGRFRGLLEAGSSTGSGVTLERYLHEKTEKVRHAWGMSLSAGTWFEIGGTDFRELTEVTRTTADGRRQITFTGARGYQGKFNGDATDWQVDLDASMPGFSATPSPLASEFDYSLFLSLTLEERRVKAKEVAALLDPAIVWDAVTVGGSADLEERLKGLLVNRKATFKYQLKLDDTAFRALLPELAARPTDRYAGALGEAMPWHSKFGPPRQLTSLRRALYGELWRKYFADRSMTPGALASLARTTLKRESFHGLAHFEGQEWRDFKGISLASLAEINSRTRADWDRFAAGMQSLERAIDQARPYEKIRESYRNIGPLFAQSHWVKGLGALLLDLLESRPELRPHVERTCTVEYNQNGQARVESISTA